MHKLEVMGDAGSSGATVLWRQLSRGGIAMIAIVVARDLGGVIGFNGDMPWGRTIKPDLRHFRELTTGGAVIMGRRTFDSIGHPLPGRQNIVLTSRPLDMPGVQVAGDPKEACSLVETGRTTFVIGGAQVYQAMLPVADVVHETVVHAEFEGDTWFPVLSRLEWHLASWREIPAGEDTRYGLEFCIWNRKWPL